MLALGLVAVLTIFGTSYSALIAVIAYDTLGLGDGAFTLLVTFTGIGALLGALIAGARRLPLSLSRLASWAVAYGVVQAVFGMSRSLWMALAMIILVGGINYFLMTSLNVLLQHLTSEARRGRVMSLFMLARGGLYPIGSLLLGSVGELISIPTALVVFAVVLIGFSLWSGRPPGPRTRSPIIPACCRALGAWDSGMHRGRRPRRWAPGREPPETGWRRLPRGCRGYGGIARVAVPRRGW